MRHIVYTRPDGGVSVCTPSQTALAFMCNGGGRWDGFDPGFLDRQIAEQSKYGVGEHAARRFIEAMQYGGCVSSEAYEIMRDRFCAYLGTGCELWETHEIPDRWFRNAWRRSHNGGPIRISMYEARKIQIAKIGQKAKRYNASLQMSKWRQRVRIAKSPDELKAVWPKDFS